MVRFNCEGSPPFVLMAESFSTPLAIRIAGENPANLQGLILCAGFATSPVHGATRRVAQLLGPLIMRVTLPEAAIRGWLLGRDAPSEMVETARIVMASVRPAVLSARLQAILACDVRDDLRRIAVPIMYLQARHDRLVGPRCLEGIRRIRQEVRAVVVDGPHFLLQAKPRQTAEIVTEFLESLG
jgi:pimeloyl-[acyl-carrier protein] methyl ester esterase